MLRINNSVIHNSSVHSTSGIRSDNAAITFCTFTNNTIESGYGLIATASEKPYTTLLVEQCTFLYNQGNVIIVQSGVDIVLNSCNFTGNNGKYGTLLIWNDGATLRTSNTSFIAPAEGNKVAVYFIVTINGTKMTDYMTYDTCFISGNTTLNSSSTDRFIQEAEAAGLIVIDKQKYPYRVTREETVFASGKYDYILCHSFQA